MWKLAYSLKFSNMTMTDNVLFISKELNNICPPIFKNWFQFCYNIHHYSTSSMKGHLHKKTFNMNYDFGKVSVNVSVVDSWNKIQVQMGEIALKDLRPSKIQWLPLTNSLKVTDLIFLNFVHSLWIHEWYCIAPNPIFLSYTNASRKQNYFDKIRTIPLVLALLSNPGFVL